MQMGGFTRVLQGQLGGCRRQSGWRWNTKVMLGAGHQTQSILSSADQMLLVGTKPTLLCPGVGIDAQAHVTLGWSLLRRNRMKGNFGATVEIR